MNIENHIGVLQPIERNNQRVLTTGQLAEAYGTDEKRISENFNRNQQRYVEGKHFALLQGEQLRAFKSEYSNCGIAQNANKLYLWTEKGAWLHAKSLNTDQAWDAYEMLVDEYYKLKEKVELTTDQLTSMLAVQLGKDVAQIKSDVDELKVTVGERMTIDYGQQLKLRTVKDARVEKLHNSGQYDIERSAMHRKAWSNYKRAFGVSSYRDTLSKDYDEAIAYLQSWRPLL